MASARDPKRWKGFSRMLWMPMRYSTMHPVIGVDISHLNLASGPIYHPPPALELRGEPDLLGGENQLGDAPQI